MGTTRRTEALAGLTAREREVLGLMAEGRSNTAIAASLFLSAGAELSPSVTDHRRVLAVLRYLES
jgi:FixJ family two-component response regulator